MGRVESDLGQPAGAQQLSRSVDRKADAGRAGLAETSIPPSKLKNGKDPDHRAGGLFPTDGK